MINNQIFQWDDIYPNETVLSQDIIKGEMYVLEENGNLVSGIVINEYQDEEYHTGGWRYTEGKKAVIHRLCVHPKAQGNGIAKQTMKYAQELIKEKGYDVIRLDTFSKNPFARRLYEGLGFTYAGEVTFRKGLFYLMEKPLSLK